MLVLVVAVVACIYVAFGISTAGTPVPGLFVANMFQVYPHDRGQNYSIELAERLVKHMDHQGR